MQKNLLVISPYFPPLTNIGAKRAINMVHELPQYNWRITVLVSKPYFEPLEEWEPDNEAVKIEYGFVSTFFRPLVQLAKGKPSKRSFQKIQKSSGSKPLRSYTPLDQYMWDIPGAIRAGRRIISKDRPDVIWVNADPWSGLWVGHALSRWSEIPWVADLRDPWTAFEKKMETRPALIRWMIRKFEKRFFTSATRIIFNTSNCLNAYNGIYKGEVSKKFTFVRNAFNLNLLKETSHPKNKDDVFRFGYFGSFRAFVPSRPLLEAFAVFVEDNRLTNSEVRFHVCGDVDSSFERHVARLRLQDYVVIDNPVPHEKALHLLRSWDCLLLVVTEEYGLMIPAKLYDYLAARKPMLALSSNTEVNQIIHKTESGFVDEINDVHQGANLFKRAFNQGKIGLLDNEKLIKPFNVIHQGRDFQRILSQITE